MSAVATYTNGSDLATTYRTRFDGLTAEQIIEKIDGALRMTVDSWLTVAYGVQLLEEQGIDTLRIRTLIDDAALLTWLRKVAAGQLRPELICRYYKRPSLVSALGRLPAGDQLKIAGGGTLPVLVPAAGGGVTSQNMTLDQMIHGQFVKQVFDRDHVRDEREQRAWLQRQQIEAAKPVPDSIGPFRIDRERKVATVGRRVIDESTLAAVLKAIRRTTP